MLKNKLITAFFMVSLAAMFIYGCKGCGKTDGPVTDTDEVAVNPVFAENPPVAENVAIEKIEGSNNEVLLQVRFAGNPVTDPLIAIDNDGEKVVLRDDGKKGDVKSADGIYTARVKLTEDEIKSILQDQRSLFQQNNGNVELFEGRTLVVKKLPEETGDMESFVKRKRIDFRFPVPCTVIPFDTLRVEKNCIMVTDLNVVQDTSRTFNKTATPGLQGNRYGVWTFWELMRQLASKDPAHIATDIQTSDFIKEWLSAWNFPQVVNGDTVPARTNIRTVIFDQWKSPTGDLLPEKTPYRLMAIANRMDLRDNPGYGGSSNAGEGRFVFCATNGPGSALPFTVIFEYGINKKGCAPVKAYADQWWALRNMTIGTPAYNTALQAITMQFTQCGTNTANTNQSSLNQLRTNEIALSSPWELREFKLLNTPPAASLKMVTVKRTPANKYNAQVPNNINVKRLANWVNANTAAYLLAQDNGIPLPDSVANPGPLTPFVGGHTFTQFPPTGPPPSAFHWDADPFPGPDSINNPLARHYFSLNTCSGCHGGETQTFFTHVTQAPWNTVASLSGFLTGITVTDAANRPQPVPNKFTFADLKRRAVDLNKIVSCPCNGFRGLMQKLFFRPLGNVH